MAKKFINIFFIILLTFNISFADNNFKNIKKYQILINLCKKLNDKSCELKYYSYLYDLADENLKLIIKKNVNEIIYNLSPNELKKIKLEKFKKNWVYNRIKNFNVNNKFYNENEIIKSNIKVIALCLPLTGEFSFIGKQILKGVLASLNFYSNPVDLKIKIFDTGKKNSLKDFLDKNRDIDLIVGPILESSINIYKSTLLNSNIPVIILNDNTELAKSSNKIFMHYINIEDEMKKACQTIIDDGVKSLAVLYPENKLGLKYKKSFLKNCSLNIVKSIIGYSPDTVDFGNILFEVGKIIKKKGNKFEHQKVIDSFLILDNVEKALIIIPQIYFYDFPNPKIYGTDLWNNKKIYKLDKKFLKNITFFDCIDYNLENPLKKIYNKNIDFYEILSYDTISIIKNITNIKELETKTFHLISGDTYFDNFGISHKKIKIFRIEGE